MQNMPFVSSWHNAVYSGWTPVAETVRPSFSLLPSLPFLPPSLNIPYPGGEAVPISCSSSWSHLKQKDIILLKSVAVRKLQVAILARSSREMSQTVRIDWKHFLSRVYVSVRPNFFIREKHPQIHGNRVARASSYFNEPASDPPLIASDPSKMGVNCFSTGRQRPIEQRQPERRQLLNGWCHGHENCRLHSRPHSHDSVIFWIHIS